MATYTCIDGDMVDAICAGYYGEESGYTEMVLEANPGLADLGPVLAAGTVVKLPTISAADAGEANDIVRLWD
ncbi:tail protein X [Mesorhizobium sp. Cs1299R1N3]|uniref:tail protein X n=1 Tax=Mesorhizobium sp. Cs1299R1N3 TaxID=3015173 RepID=UPI00301C6F91